MRMGYKQEFGLGKSEQGKSELLEDSKERDPIKDEMNSNPLPGSGYSTFAKKQMVWTDSNVLEWYWLLFCF